MTEVPKKDLPASVLARLLNRARETGEDYQTLDSSVGRRHTLACLW